MLSIQRLSIFRKFLEDSEDFGRPRYVNMVTWFHQFVEVSEDFGRPRRDQYSQYISQYFAITATQK